MAAEDNSWRTQAFRQSVVSKIDEAIQRSGMSTSRNSVDMENHVFQKAKTREDYLGLVARLILHVREINTKKMQGPTAGQTGGGMQDPINALQTLASQGTRNTQLMGGPQSMQPIPAPNLLQTLNRPGMTLQGQMGGQLGASMQGGQGMNQMSGQLQNQLQNQMANQMQAQVSSGQIAQLQQLQPQLQANLGIASQGPNVQGGPNQLQGQLPNQLQGQLSGQMSGQLQNQLSGQLQTQLQNQLQGQLQSQMQSQMGGQMQGQMSSQIQGQLQLNQLQASGGQMGHMQARKPNDGMMMSATPGGGGFPGPRNPTPTQFLTQSPTQGVQSPAGLGAVRDSGQMVASPALVPSPSSQMGMLSGPGSQAPSSQAARSAPSLAASPSGSLNTPGAAAQPSPLQHEEQAYRDKVRQLSKYIEPLRKMIARMGNDDVEKLSKMKKLLEILSNPTQRMPLETLIKCEVVLEKLDLKRGEGASCPGAGAPHLPLKEHHVFSPLLEAVSQQLQSPVANHTMHRTFGPALEALFGPEIKLPPPLKRRKTTADSNQELEISGVLQGEIARLDQRFKVTMSPLKQPGSRSVQLMCHLDDRQLPCVPPVSLSVPEDYPHRPPLCHVSPHDYDATHFLQAVKRALLARIDCLPHHFSVSQLLATWEMSIRQASAPKQLKPSPTTVLMGL